LNCTLEVEFSINDDRGDNTHWFGVRFRGRGEAQNFFDGCLVYVRSNGKMDLAILGQIVEFGQVVNPPVNSVKLKIAIIDHQLSVYINDKLVRVFPANGVMRSGRVYLHAAKTTVTIKSAQLLSQETI
jgi:hypothetical protein